MSKEEFLEGMTFLGIAYNKEFTKEEIEVWYSMLCGYSKKEFSDAIKRLVKTLKRIPTIADLTEEITNGKVNNMPNAEDEWQNVLKAVKKKIEYRKEIERLNKELEIRDILIKGIDKRIDNHFRKIDRCVFEDTNKLIEIQDLIKKALGSDKE